MIFPAAVCRRFFLPLAPFAAAALFACAESQNLDPAAPVVREARVPYFSSVRLVGTADVRVDVGPLRGIAIEESPRHANSVEFDMRSDELQILTAGVSNNDTTRPTVHINVPDLMAVRLTGNGDIVVTGTLRRPDFEIYNAGRGRITITTGTVDLAAVRVLRTGSVDAYGLTANQVHVRIDGSGDATIFARHAVNVDNTGSGNLRVHGSPAERNLRLAGRRPPPVQFLDE